MEIGEIDAHRPLILCGLCGRMYNEDEGHICPEALIDSSEDFGALKGIVLGFLIGVGVWLLAWLIMIWKA